MSRKPLWAGPLLAGLLGSPLLPPAPAAAVEEIVVTIPLLDASLKLRVSELQSAEALRRGSSDLAELDRASNGAVGRQLLAVLNQPVPLSITQVADGSVGSPLLEQALLVLSSFGTVEGRPADLSGETLRQALLKASSNGQPTLLSLIQAIPGERVTLDLGRARTIALRMAAQRREAERLLTTLPPAPAAQPSALSGVSPIPSVPARTVQLAVAHRPKPLDLVVLEPRSGANGRLVLISHGLWDSPANFVGWENLNDQHFIDGCSSNPPWLSSEHRLVSLRKWLHFR